MGYEPQFESETDSLHKYLPTVLLGDITQLSVFTEDWTFCLPCAAKNKVDGEEESGLEKGILTCALWLITEPPRGRPSLNCPKVFTFFFFLFPLDKTILSLFLLFNTHLHFLNTHILFFFLPTMRVFVLGGSGNVGKLVVQQLLSRGHEVHAIVRSPESMPSALVSEPKLSLIKANLLDLSIDDLSVYMKGSDAVVCTLGHNLNYGRVPVLGKVQLGFCCIT